MWRKILELLPGAWVGWAEYHFRPSIGGYGILNGQEGRRALFEDIIEQFQCDAIIETGTYKASTTLYFSQFAETVISLESSSRYFTYARLRTVNVKNIEILRGFSEELLPKILRRPDLREKRIFFYLDAHWGGTLPLRRELTAIAELTRDNLIMIDDFEIPGDSGYRFDDYGGTDRLDLSYLRRLDLGRDLFVFFPTIASAEETGFRQGYCLATNSSDVASLLRRNKSVEPAEIRLARIGTGATASPTLAAGGT